MDFKSVGQMISKFAPLLGTVVGGAPGGVIGTLIANAFGADATNPQDILNKIQADPDAQAKLVEIQTNCKVELQRIAMQVAANELSNETQQQQIALQNVKDAREKNNNNKSSWMPEIVSFITIVGFFGCIVLISQFHQEPQDQNVLYMLVGNVGAAFGAVVNYWLGSSLGSKVKDYLKNK